MRSKLYALGLLLIAGALILSGCGPTGGGPTETPTAAPPPTEAGATPASSTLAEVAAYELTVAAATATPETPAPTPSPQTPLDIAFGNPKKSPHYESNTPAHGALLAGVPINVVMDVNFDLGPGSSISVLKDGVDYGTGGTVIDSNKLAMRRDMDPNAPEGLYTVNYKACWPDGSCHDGSFQFAIVRQESARYTDLRGQDEVQVVMKSIAFVPEKIWISKGTEVVWTNQDNVVHYVNTDSHPAHTYYPQQNSEALDQGDVFVLVFDRPGTYPYHCSAHTNMTGSILVE